ncbi:hypothetical protein BC832DRAFT_554849 [Gaertneriomyces semiglobifer]|nr:hypothetical protein BC832DRAFT_554849 [Gaertneriomyces semiglobifer]
MTARDGRLYDPSSYMDHPPDHDEQHALNTTFAIEQDVERMIQDRIIIPGSGYAVSLDQTPHAPLPSSSILNDPTPLTETTNNTTANTLFKPTPSTHPRTDQPPKQQNQNQQRVIDRAKRILNQHRTQTTTRHHPDDEPAFVYTSTTTATTNASHDTTVSSTTLHSSRPHATRQPLASNLPRPRPKRPLKPATRTPVSSSSDRNCMRPDVGRDTPPLVFPPDIDPKLIIDPRLALKLVLHPSDHPTNTTNSNNNSNNNNNDAILPHPNSVRQVLAHVSALERQTFDPQKALDQWTTTDPVGARKVLERITTKALNAPLNMQTFPSSLPAFPNNEHDHHDPPTTATTALHHQTSTTAQIHAIPRAKKSSSKMYLQTRAAHLAVLQSKTNTNTHSTSTSPISETCVGYKETDTVSVRYPTLYTPVDVRDTIEKEVVWPKVCVESWVVRGMNGVV